MPKRKWYVVVVGRDVGVFPSWLEAGELVKGVPNALHQSFNTREEALRQFQDAQARGATRIVDPGAPRNDSHRSYNDSPHTFTSSTPSRTRRAPVPTSQTDRFRHTASPTPLSASFSWSSSEPPSKVSRLQEIHVAFDRLEASGSVGVRTRAPSVMTHPSDTRALTATRVQRASTATPDMFRGSRRLTTDAATTPPRMIVKAPSWIPSHPGPESSTPDPSEPSLSPPLSSVNLKLRSFSIDDHPEDASPSVRRHSASNATGSRCLKKKTHNPPQQGIIQNHRIIHDADPRSPILDQFQVPELVYENVENVVFARPSPQVTPKAILNLSSPSHVGSSLLFKNETPLSPMRG